MEIIVRLPSYFQLETMQAFINDAMFAAARSDLTAVVFDMSDLQSIEPEGVAALSNAIEYFKLKGKQVYLRGQRSISKATRYLDDAGFFGRYLGKQIFADSAPRDTTMPLELFKASNYLEYLYWTLMPWIGRSVNLSTDALDSIRTSLEEAFHNVKFHSGLDVACTFSEHFKRQNRICIAVSDWGIGIPSLVRTKVPGLTDEAALLKAAEEGFSTAGPKRGAGLPNLFRYVAQRNGGEVRIHSGSAMLVATRGTDRANVLATPMSWLYPGTLVHVVLRTDTLEKAESDVKPEEFSWS